MSPTALSTIRAMDRPLSFLKIIYLAYTHLFHRGSFAFNRRIVCFRPFRSSVFILFKFREDRAVWPGSSALTHRSSALTNGSSALTNKSSVLAQKIVCFDPGSSAFILSRIVCFDTQGSSAFNRTHRISQWPRLNRCWSRILETFCVGDKFDH